MGVCISDLPTRFLAEINKTQKVAQDRKEGNPRLYIYIYYDSQ